MCLAVLSTRGTSCSTSSIATPWSVCGAAERVHQRVRLVRVQSREGLVEQEDGRLLGEGAGDFDEAGRAERERVDSALAFGGDAQQLEQTVDAVSLGGRLRPQRTRQ